MLHLLVLLGLTGRAACVTHTYLGTPGKHASTSIAVANSALLNSSLSALLPGDTLVIPNDTYVVMGGVHASGLAHSTIQLDGTLLWSDDTAAWPKNDKMPVVALTLENSMGLTITSKGIGTLDGQGAKWWGLPGLGYLLRGKNRPPMLAVKNATNFLLERVLFSQAPRFNFVSEGLNNATIRWCDVSSRRTNWDSHSALDLTAFNTDGFDLSGRDIHVHDCTVWNQDDTFCIKASGEDTENVLIENVHASGVGLSIGSIGGRAVRNITFRNVVMHHTSKGIYIKFRDSGSMGSISDVLYENVLIDEPSSWPIWIGPAQQDIKGDGPGIYNPCHGDPCSLCWPTIKSANCNAVPGVMSNLTLRNITILNPKLSPGVIYGNESSPIRGLVFDGVKFVNPPKDGAFGGSYFFCEGVTDSVAIGDTWPVPRCFDDRTD